MAQGGFARWLEKVADRTAAKAGKDNDETVQEILDAKIRNYGADSERACDARDFYARTRSRRALGRVPTPPRGERGGLPPTGRA
jgi:hypothetical protein